MIDDIRKQNEVRREYWEKQGYTYRKATKADHPEMLRLGGETGKAQIYDYHYD